MNTQRNVDFGLGYPHTDPAHRQQLINFLHFKLATHGLSSVSKLDDEFVHTLATAVAPNFRQKNRLLENYLPPADQRIQAFLDDYLQDVPGLEAVPRLPGNTFVLNQYGLARELSLPPDADEFHTDIVHSYRIKQGILHNPKHDRRTTKGVFHVSDGGLPIPADKKSVPRIAFARLLAAALQPPDDLARLPFTPEIESPDCRFVSLLLNPMVQPAVENVLRERYLEIRFLVPGNLVSNLDFVESIFGNAGDPYLPQHDSALDPEHWTGHTGCIILATHLTTLKKKDLGLPHVDDANERQKREGMCWSDPDELYNDGSPFKITARDERGIMVTLIADNYFGYSKKEVKTQTSYSANLLGLVEEEHAGGALAYPSYKLGVTFVPDSNLRSASHSFAEARKLLGDAIAVKPEGYGVDQHYPQIIYLPEDAEINLEDQQAIWTDASGQQQALRVLPDRYYIHPTGYKITMDPHPQSNAWYLTGTVAEGTLCHKPCTVSGGGKSEISKSIWDAIHFTPLFIADFKKDMDYVKAIIDRDYSDRFIDPPEGPDHVSRKILSSKRSLGSVIKLLTPDPENKPAFNEWLHEIPHRIKALVFMVKRFYQEDWGEGWRDRFSVDVVNGASGNILKFMNRPLLASYLRVGLRNDGTGWTHKLRQDFLPSRKVQWEDDISASAVVPQAWVEGLNPAYDNQSIKFTQNCEFRFFQRPDEAVHRGYDKQAELDLSSAPAFVSNFEPLPRELAQGYIERTLDYTEYTEPVRQLLQEVAQDEDCSYFALSSQPRMIDGKPSKNPRYLQTDPAQLRKIDRYLADVGTRLFRKIPADKPVYHPINAILPGRRNNPPDYEKGIRPLSVYGPIHYQQLPELFMDFVSSLTGKSPSTTGAGSEGALTKGPFNALVATTDLNNALLSFILTGYDGFSSAAGHIGEKYRVDHDISLLMPEIWGRLTPQERDPAFLIENGYFERLEDFEHKGQPVLASRLGYRVTSKFASGFLGRIFDSPELVFPQEMLQPELQGLDAFADGIHNIVETQQRVAQAYLDDGSVEGAIPPLKALIHVMAEGSYEGMRPDAPAFRKLFERESVLQSDWYQERLVAFQQRELEHLDNEIVYLEGMSKSGEVQASQAELDLTEKLACCRQERDRIAAADFVPSLQGTIGRDRIYQG